MNWYDDYYGTGYSDWYEARHQSDDDWDDDRFRDRDDI